MHDKAAAYGNMAPMTRLRHTIATRALDRREVESLLPTLHEIAESMLVQQADAIPEEEIRRCAERGELALPRRLRQGERFTAPLDDTARLTTSVWAWDRRAQSALKLELASERPDLEAAEGTAEVSFRSAEHPGRLEVSARGALNRWTVFGRPMVWGEGSARLDWPRWWEALTTGADGPAPVTAQAAFTPARATVAITPSRGEPGEWLLEISVTVTGRGIWRPLVGTALWLARGAVRRRFAEQLDEAARELRDEDFGRFPRTPEELLALYLESVLRETGEDEEDAEDQEPGEPGEEGGAHRAAVGEVFLGKDGEANAAGPDRTTDRP
jgi:hypothetical protein